MANLILSKPGNLNLLKKWEKEKILLLEEFPTDKVELREIVEKVMKRKLNHHDVEGAEYIDNYAVLCAYAKKNKCYFQFYNAIMFESQRECCGIEERLGKRMDRLIAFLLTSRFKYIRCVVQTKPSLSCKYPFKMHGNKACINPQHYRLTSIPRTPIPSVYINKEQNYGDAPIRTDEPYEDPMIWQELMEKQQTPVQTQEQSKQDTEQSSQEAPVDSTAPNLTFVGDEIRMVFTRYDDGVTDPYQLHANFGSKQMLFFNRKIEQDGDETPTSSNKSISESALLSALQSMVMPKQQKPAESVEMEDEESESVYYQSGLSSPASSITSPRLFLSNQNNSFSINQNFNNFNINRPLSNQEMEQNGNNVGIVRPTHPDGTPFVRPIEPRPLFRSSASELGNLIRKAAFECVQYRESPFWIRLLYFEESEKVGDTVQFGTKHCVVDGFSSSSNSTIERGTEHSRFSIGFQTNPKRSVLSSTTRDLIGYGVRLSLIAGEVYIENLGGCPVFVHSICANMRNSFPLNTVIKVPKRGSFKIFDLQVFADRLSEASNKTYQDVYCLSRLCTIRLSFYKGWGQDYKRKSILQTPIWFLIHLNNPMGWIDQVLGCMGAPPALCSSRT